MTGGKGKGALLNDGTPSLAAGGDLRAVIDPLLVGLAVAVPQDGPGPPNPACGGEGVVGSPVNGGTVACPASNAPKFFDKNWRNSFDFEPFLPNEQLPEVGAGCECWFSKSDRLGFDVENDPCPPSR